MLMVSEWGSPDVWDLLVVCRVCGGPPDRMVLASSGTLAHPKRAVTLGGGGGDVRDVEQVAGRVSLAARKV